MLRKTNPMKKNQSSWELEVRGQIKSDKEELLLILDASEKKMYVVPCISNLANKPVSLAEARSKKTYDHSSHLSTRSPVHQT